MLKYFITSLFFILFSSNVIASVTISGGQISGNTIGASDESDFRYNFDYLKDFKNYKILISNVVVTGQAWEHPVIIFLPYNINPNGSVDFTNGFYIFAKEVGSKSANLGMLEVLNSQKLINMASLSENDIYLPSLWKYIDWEEVGRFSFKSFIYNDGKLNFSGSLLSGNGNTHILKGYVHEGDIFELEQKLLEFFPNLYSKIDLKEELSFLFGIISEEWKTKNN